MAEQSMAVLDERGVVTNVVIVDGDDRWDPPAGSVLRALDGQPPAIGARWDGTAWQDTSAVQAPDLQAQIDALTALVLGGGS